MRILIDYVLPLLAPTILWLLWIAVSERRARQRGVDMLEVRRVPFAWLLAAGFLLAMLVAAGDMIQGGYAEGGYHPARIGDDGRLVPGGIR